MSRRNIHPHHYNDRLDYSDKEYDDDGEYDDGGNNTRGRDRTENDILWARCHELQRIVNSLRTELRMKKSLFWQTKRQIRIDYDWDGEEANLSEKVSEWVKEYLFPRYKFPKEGWMEYSDKNESLSLFVKRKMKMEHDEYVGLWERVICPTIQMKYVTIRCNLNNEVRKAYRVSQDETCSY
jgi:hypothetical protein